MHAFGVYAKMSIFNLFFSLEQQVYTAPLKHEVSPPHGKWRGRGKEKKRERVSVWHWLGSNGMKSAPRRYHPYRWH